MVKRASIITVLVLSLISSCYGQVTVGYYNNKCGTKDVESIIRGVVQARFSYEAAIVAFLLRLQFHDCLGGHTVGVTHCSVIKDRLYNYKGTQSADPDLDAFYVFFLGNIICHNDPNAVDMFVFLDSPDSVLTVDNSYYKMLLNHKGILPIDNAIAFDPSTSGYVNDLANNNDYFLDLFGKTIVKMGLIGVLTGNQGEIRQVCSRTN
ncbi:Peroxidase [Rhynchospora pubera]|uniref:Peroxidase n=1 Tax=Rhynchospora pubera TaxID=906938 RepID=A0AAV8EFC2_9POAL|nr:Peroxidase [Rhynchospora pubera]